MISERLFQKNIYMSDKGRPERSEIDQFRTMAWFNSVAWCERTDSAFQLQTRFQPAQIRSQGDKPNSSGAWDKYKQGTRSPKDGYDQYGNPHVVTLVGNKHPETLEVWNHLLWLAMCDGRVELAKVYEFVKTLPKNQMHFYLGFEPDIYELSPMSIVYSLKDDVWIEYCDSPAAFNHLAINLMQLRFVLEQNNDASKNLPALIKKTAKLIGMASQCPWIEDFYEDLYDWLEINLWGDLFDQHYKPKNASNLKGWRSSIQDWLIQEEDPPWVFKTIC